MATLQDVAHLAGVGLGTASRVVSGKGGVSPAKQALVRNAIEQLNFRPSRVARSLMSGSSQMIGVYIPILKGSFYTPILAAIDAKLRAAGLHMVVAFGAGDGDARRQAIEGIAFLMERGCDGLIVMSSPLSNADISKLGAKKSQLVVLNQVFNSIPDQCFSADHRQGGRMAAQVLLKHGHRQIAVISGPSTAADNIDRISGFMDELTQAGIDTSKLWMEESDFSPEGGCALAKSLLASGYKFTALFCANDEMAVGALSHFQQAGISVPDQVSVLGYDDTFSAEFSAPPLTCVHMPLIEVTLSGINFLLNRCYGSNEPVSRDFPIEITWRATVAAIT
jgi:LacI family transcriptional regulator